MNGSADMEIRRFKPGDETEISHIIRRNALEVNIRDYSRAEMENLAGYYSAQTVADIAARAHTHMLCKGTKIIGTGSISSLNGSKCESELLMIFVSPERHERGAGRIIMNALEHDELFLRAWRVELNASVTGCGFYEKMGYYYKDGMKRLDGDGLYCMEKLR